MGEMPPRTRRSPGARARTARAARRVMSAYCRHSGSIVKSQWDRLFGSFQNLIASITAAAPGPTRAAAPRARPPGDAGQAPADEHLLLRMREELEAGAAEHRLGAGAVGDPPVRRVAGVA